eukprot:s878_g10.t1
MVSKLLGFTPDVWSHGEEVGSFRATSAKPGDAETKVEAKRTAEEIREVVERLAQGCSARPRKTRPRRGKEEEKEDSIGGAMEEVPATGERRRAGRWAMAPVIVECMDFSGSHSNRYMDVQVGDVIRVQTNLGWESVTVRAKRQGTGKIDIQFKDGEYMRSVMPRILRTAEGQAVKDSQESPPTALPPPWPPRSHSHGGAPLAAPQMAPVPTSTTGAVPQKLAGYKGGPQGPLSAQKPSLVAEPIPGLPTIGRAVGVAIAVWLLPVESGDRAAVRWTSGGDPGGNHCVWLLAAGCCVAPEDELFGIGLWLHGERALRPGRGLPLLRPPDRALRCVVQRPIS